MTHLHSKWIISISHDCRNKKQKSMKATRDFVNQSDHSNSMLCTAHQDSKCNYTNATPHKSQRHNSTSSVDGCMCVCIRGYEPAAVSKAVDYLIGGEIAEMMFPFGCFVCIFVLPRCVTDRYMLSIGRRKLLMMIYFVFVTLNCSGYDELAGSEVNG